jgi:L-asparaginase
MTNQLKQNELQRRGSLIANRRAFLRATGVVGGTSIMAGKTAADAVEEGLLIEDDLPEPDEQPNVKLISTGGTIASTQAAQEEDAGYSLSEQAEQILETVPLIDEFVNITIEEVAEVPSPELVPDDFVAVAEAAREADANGFDGVIVTHGTSSIEENAYYNDLILDLDIPVVFVGAMRPADADSADGPANLLTAVRTVTRREFHLEDEPSGVYVAMNNEVHAARDVTKMDTHKVETFDSGPKGPIAIFTDDELLLYRNLGSHSADLSECTSTNKNVPIITTAAGANAFVIEQTLEGNYDADGFVIKVVGRSGSSPDLLAAREQAVDAGYPIVRTSLNVTGPVAPTDGENDEITAGDMNGRKARLHLMLALETTSDFRELQASFDESSYGIPVVAPSTIEVDSGTESEVETDNEDEE